MTYSINVNPRTIESIILDSMRGALVVDETYPRR